MTGLLLMMTGLSPCAVPIVDRKGTCGKGPCSALKHVLTTEERPLKHFLFFFAMVYAAQWALAAFAVSAREAEPSPLGVDVSYAPISLTPSATANPRARGASRLISTYYAMIMSFSAGSVGRFRA